MTLGSVLEIAFWVAVVAVVIGNAYNVGQLKRAVELSAENAALQIDINADLQGRVLALEERLIAIEEQGSTDVRH